jgi:hypothetical protein
MKTIFSFLLILISGFTFAQFEKNVASAKTAYAGGNLEDARFAMQNALNDIDLTIGKEILKLLPTKMDAMAANTKDDNVTINTGLTGALTHRSYGTADKSAYVDIMSNSPLVASINAILSIPFVGNAGDGSQKVVKVQGYKSILNREENSETGATSYNLQTPIGATLVTFHIRNTTEADALRLANTLPIPQIAKMLQ